jgi:hypothetical protein
MAEDWIIRTCPCCHLEKFYVKQLRIPPHTIRFTCAGCDEVLGDVGPPPEPQAQRVVGGRLQP